MPARIFNLDESGLSTVMKPYSNSNSFISSNSRRHSRSCAALPEGSSTPCCQGRKKIRACILTEDEELLTSLREKEKKKAAREEKKRRSEEKKREKKREQEARQGGKEEEEVGDFVLVQLVFKGKRSEELVHFVAKVISLEEDGRLQLDFLRIKSPLLKDTFHFPAIGMSTVSTAAGCWGSSQSARGPPNDKQT
ncbi:hypothetical protein GWK47_031599 [Chionoecetes opilio]|uniref:Uncharacterized protein n=1 Tax=Chionoecetes opilio TaxID=41210 RepID=A0A8J4YV12_CHIOP|nr:hypothetical protein GWK47_031599 [Chionoecetes opilio]